MTDRGASIPSGSQEEKLIQVKSVSAVFPNGNGGLRVLDDISFEISSQEFVCILGPSGCGKSTLLRLLAGLLVPTAGQILYKGQQNHGPRSGVGFVFQKANLMPWRTALQNISLPLELSGIPAGMAAEKALQMVELVRLNGFENALPRDLSGGMAQRVAIARALVHDPEVLLMDEPFGSLDALTRDRMARELLQIWQIRKKTVVMVTHSIDEALFLADRVLVISHHPGRLCLDLRVTLARPRMAEMRYTSRFGELARLVRQAIGDAELIAQEGQKTK